MRASPTPAIEAALERIRAWAGSPQGTTGEAADDDRGRPVTRAELAQLNESDLIELGAHTAGHPSMLALSRHMALAEVESSRRFLADFTGNAPSSFSFPFGDNGPASRRVVRECGFDHAVGVRWNMPFTAAARKFEIPRLMAVEEDEEALAARMSATLRFHGQRGAAPRT
jgi:peptidoglycan/xylan/chitin deacetylase (PgdA/CDA1 family)